MGYTHYFPQTQECPPEQWATFKQAVMRCFELRPDVPVSAGQAHATGLPFNICDGSAEVVRTEAAELFIDDGEEAGEILIFNGDDTHGRDFGHETMLMMQKRDPEYAFCKTERKPYDWLVVNCLLLAHHHCPGVWTITSDGWIDELNGNVAWLRSHGFGAIKMPPGIKPRPADC
jgi:hypothetical protein